MPEPAPRRVYPVSPAGVVLVEESLDPRPIPEQRPNVLLVTSQALLRHAVGEALEQTGRVQVKATAAHAKEAIAQAQRHEPDVVVVFDDLDEGSYLGAVGEIVDGLPGCSVLVLVQNADDEELVRAVEVGARGYVSRRAGLADLCDAIERIARRGVAIPEEMHRALLESLVRRRTQDEHEDEVLSQLSPREREVLLLLAEGASSARIAEALVITKETARKHTQNVLVKMGVRSRLAAVAYVMQGNRLELLRASGRVERARSDASRSA